jgi:N utilization substance protein A
VDLFNSKTLNTMIETIANTNELSKEDARKALEAVFSVSARQSYSKDTDIVANISDDYEVSLYKRYTVIDDNHTNLDDGEQFLSDRHLYVDQAEEKFDKEYSANDEILIEIDDYIPKRNNFNVANQQLNAKIKEIKKEKLKEKFKHKGNELVSVVVKKFDKNGYTVEYNNDYLGYLPNEYLFNNSERLRVGNKYYVLFDNSENKFKTNHGLIFKRCGDEFIKAIFEREIDEIQNEVINIMGIYRSDAHKIVVAVHSSDQNIDVVGACLGLRCVRITNIMKNFNGESVDIVDWNSNEAITIANVLNNASIVRIIKDENQYQIIVDNDIELAKGKAGYKEKALSAFLNKEVKILSQDDFEDSSSKMLEYFAKELMLDEDSASIVADSGVSSIDELAYCSIPELAEILGVDEESAGMLKERATERLEKRNAEIETYSTDLKTSELLDEFLIDKLIINNINNLSELADLDVFELMDYAPINEKEASAIIMEARKIWE